MIDAIVLKIFAGLEVGRITQLKDWEFEKLHASGHVQKVGADEKSAPIISKKSSEPKATKK
jgi:hypothetical protein